jgi:hypothetical protein
MIRRIEVELNALADVGLSGEYIEREAMAARVRTAQANGAWVTIVVPGKSGDYRSLLDWALARFPEIGMRIVSAEALPEYWGFNARQVDGEGENVQPIPRFVNSTAAWIAAIAQELENQGPNGEEQRFGMVVTGAPGHTSVYTNPAASEVGEFIALGLLETAKANILSQGVGLDGRLTGEPEDSF